MKIAAIVDEEGRVVNRLENGRLRLYEQTPEGWTLLKQIGLEVRGGMGLAEVKALLKQTFAQLEDCRVFLVGELRGLLFVLLQESGFRIWKSEGNIVEQMDQVVRKEAEAVKVVEQPVPAPVPVGPFSEGHYQINLAEVLKNDPGLNSKQVLIPFMEKLAFQKLEILCEHLPRWFPHECERLNLRAETGAPDPARHEMKVILLPKTKITLPP
jgi:Fe-only nitrogenase accessory protein AnfO